MGNAEVAAGDGALQKSFEKLKEINSSRDGSMTSKAVKYLDWKPRVQLDEGLKSTIDYFKTQLGIETQ